MIQPIGLIHNQLHFRGKIKETVILKDSMSNFSEKELAEFNTLKNKASKVYDGKELTVYKNSKFAPDSFEKATNIYSIGILDENNEFLSSEIYKIASSEKISKQKIHSEDKTAFARAILNPLRDLYANVKI